MGESQLLLHYVEHCLHVADLMVCLLVVGAHQLTSPPSQSESLLAMFDPLSSHEGKLVV